MKNEESKSSNKWYIIVGLSSFFFGFILGPQGKTTTSIQEVVREVQVAPKCDYSDWEELKDIQTEAMVIYTENFTVCRNAFVDAVNGDVDSFDDYGTQMKFNAGKLEVLTGRAREAIDRLGL